MTGRASAACRKDGSKTKFGTVGRLAQLVRARASHARGHRFESCSAHHPTHCFQSLRSLASKRTSDPSVRSSGWTPVEYCAGRNQCHAGVSSNVTPPLTVAPAPDTRMEAGAAGDGSAGQPAEAGLARPSLFSARLHEDIAVALLYVNLKDRMKTEESRVHFYPNGTSDEFTIILQMGRGVRKISLDCVTGLANVEVIQ